MLHIEETLAVHTDPISLVLNHQIPPFIPTTAPYERIGPLQILRAQLYRQKWWNLLDQASAHRIEINFQTYFDLQLSIYTDIIEGPYPPPAWHEVNVNSLYTREEIEGASIARKENDLFWIAADGRETWIPPYLGATQDMDDTVDTVSRKYAHYWELGDEPATVLQAALTRRIAEQPKSAPTEAEVEALLHSGRFDIIRALMEKYEGQFPLYWLANSPAVQLLLAIGFKPLVEAYADAPELIHRYFEACLPRPTAQLAAVRKLGVDVLFLQDSMTTTDIISPKMFREFGFPYLNRTIEAYNAMGFRVVFYIMGSVMPLLEDIKELPFAALGVEEDRKNYGIDLAEVRRVMGPERVLLGNIDTLFLEKAADQEILDEVRRQIEIAGRGGNFIVSPGSPMTPGTSLERIRLLCESTRKMC